MDQPKTFVYHLDAEIVSAAIEKLGELPYSDVYDIIGALLVEHEAAQKRPYIPEVKSKQKLISTTKTA